MAEGSTYWNPTHKENLNDVTCILEEKMLRINNFGRSKRSSYSFNYQRTPAERSFLNVRCSLTIQNNCFKLEWLRHGSSLWNYFKFRNLFWIKPKSDFFGIFFVKGVWWSQFLLDLNLELQKIPWKTKTLIFNQIPKCKDFDFRFI